jgi:hypothetical protein
VLLIVLVALPSAGLSGFGVLAIVNERSAVEKRLELIWSGKLLSVGDDLLTRLRATKLSSTTEGLIVEGEDGKTLSDASFRLSGENVTATDPKVKASVLSMVPVLSAVSELPVFFTLSTVTGPVLFAARREGEVVSGARIPLDRLTGTVEQLTEKHRGNEPVRFVLQPVKPPDEEAVTGGLVNKVVPGADLMKTATDMMKAMLANAPLALAGCIEMVNRGYDVSIGDALALEAGAFGLLAATEDKREGTRAFLEKRPATFKGA